MTNVYFAGGAVAAFLFGILFDSVPLSVLGATLVYVNTIT